MTKTAAEKAARSAQHRQELIDRGFIDPNMPGEDGLSMLDLDNNDSEHLIALNNIREAMERGTDLMTAKREYGIPGQPYYSEM